MLAPLILMLSAATAPKLAAPDWSVVNLSAELGNFYAEETARFLRANGVEVVTNRDIATLIGIDRQKQLLGCDEGNSCMAELGAALGSEAVLIANLAKLDSSFRGSLRVISSQSGKVLVEIPITASGERALVDALEDGAREIASTLRPDTRPRRPSARQLSWIPLLAGVLVGGGGATFIVLAHRNFDAIPQSTEPVAIGLARDGELFQVVGWTAVTVAGAALLSSALMFALGEPPPVTPSVAVSSREVSFGLTVRLP